MNNKLKLTDYDFRVGREIWGKEKIASLMPENIFKAFIYVILSSTERYDKQLMVYEEMLRNNLDGPISIHANSLLLENIVGKARFPNNKIKHIKKLAEWGLDNNYKLSNKIIEDIKNKRKNGFEIRDEIADEVPGVGRKCASLLMSKCGYENIVPVDIWMIRFLSDAGYEVEIPNYKTNRGPSKEKYHEYEKIISEIAEKYYNVSPIIFQCTLWGRHSTYRNKIPENPNQLRIGF